MRVVGKVFLLCGLLYVGVLVVRHIWGSFSDSSSGSSAQAGNGASPNPQLPYRSGLPSGFAPVGSSSMNGSRLDGPSFYGHQLNNSYPPPCQQLSQTPGSQVSWSQLDNSYPY